jgi:hypothetical protein
MKIGMSFWQFFQPRAFEKMSDRQSLADFNGFIGGNGWH